MEQFIHPGIWLMILVCYAGYAWSVNKFCQSYLDGTKGKGIVFAAIFFCGHTLIGILCEIWYVPYIIHALVRHILFLILVLFMFRTSTEKKILAVSVLIAVQTFVGNFCDSFFSCIWMLFLKGIQDGAAVYIHMQDSYIISCLALVVVILVIRELSRRMDSVFWNNRERKWYIMLAVPLIFIVMVVDVVNYGASSGVTVVSDANGAEYWNVYYNQLLSHGAICLLTALSMCAAGVYLFGMDKISIEQRKKEQVQSQIRFYKMLEEQYSRMERLRHDMKNHIIGLQGLLENKEWGKLGDYLNQMAEAGSIREAEDITGNRVVDALLYEKRNRAEEKGIDWRCNVEFMPECGIDEFDLCVLFGNVLDNAIEACEFLKAGEHRFIDIQVRQVKKCLLLEVKNSTDTNYTEETVKHSFTGNTKKKDSWEHGIGLLNVTDTVYKYNGVVDREVIENIFVISILLPFKDAI